MSCTSDCMVLERGSQVSSDTSNLDINIPHIFRKALMLPAMSFTFIKKTWLLPAKSSIIDKTVNLYLIP